MFIHRVHSRQAGNALVFSLLILLVMTIIGLSSMSNIQMQERMAGNVNVQSVAFEAASAGISQALEYGMSEWDTNGCNREDGQWRGDYDNPIRLEFMAEAVQNLTVQYRLKADCLEDPDFGDDPEDATYVPPVQMYVTSQGQVFSGQEQLTSREIEVRIDDLRTDGRSAMRFEGEADVTFGAPNSNRFSADGQGGPAISTTTQENAQNVANEIGDSRLGNYSGGVARSDYDPPFNSAWQMARFVLEIKAYMEYHGYVGAHTPAAECNLPVADIPNMAYFAGNFNVGGGTNFDGITYVQGNLTMGGNPTGTGVVIVEGDTEWRGTAEFQGLVLALGGDFSIGGGGNGETEGMVYAADLNLAAMQPAYNELLLNWDHPSGPRDYDCWSGCPTAISDPGGQSWEEVLARLDAWGNPNAGDAIGDTEYSVLYQPAPQRPDGFGSSNIDMSGGGNHSVTYDCGMVDDQRVTLSTCGRTIDPDGTNGFEYDGLADPWDDQLCNTPGRGGKIQAIRSWRENLGWRELLTGG